MARNFMLMIVSSLEADLVWFSITDLLQTFLYCVNSLAVGQRLMVVVLGCGDFRVRRVLPMALTVLLGYCFQHFCHRIL